MTHNHDNQAEGQIKASEPKSVSIPRHVLGMAIRQAESSVDEIQSKIVNVEKERDELVYRLANAQEQLDRLRGELDYRSRHLRMLQAAAD